MHLASEPLLLKRGISGPIQNGHLIGQGGKVVAARPWWKLGRSLVYSLTLISQIACGPRGSQGSEPPLQDPSKLPEPQPPVVDPGTPPPPSVIGDVPRLGTGDSFELAAWNIENFPKNREKSLSMTASIFQQMDLDIIGVEEIADSEAFRELLDKLPAYGSVLSSHEYNPGEYQKLGLLYREEQFQYRSHRLLFEGDAYAFPRPPLEVRLRFRQGSRQGQDLIVIVVHLKASGDQTSRLRREKANLILADHVQQLEQAASDVPVAIIGDFNERTTLEAGRLVFQPWLSRPDLYQFYTEPLGAAGDYSFISPSKPLIDHIISTKDLIFEEVNIPKLEMIVPNYEPEVSDHLPVVVRTLL